MVVFTAGYEAKNIEGFAELLVRHGITLLVDVRELPLSRKRGFSKSQIREYLGSLDIGYFHMRSLGSPRSIRKELKETGDYERFFEQYREHLSSQREALAALEELVENQSVCLMCYEKDPHKCHRSVIAKELSDRGGVEAWHL